MKYKLAIFDMDGTILNTLEDLTDSLNHTLKAFGYPVHSIDNVRRFVGNGIRKLIERALPADSTEERIDEVFAAFMPYYNEHCADKTKPYDGISELILELRNAGCLTAVVSNKADSAVQELCVKYFNGLFDAAAGEKPGINKKPAPDSVNLILDTLKLSANDAVYIGDSEVDIATAKNSLMDAIIVSWGFREVPFLKEHGAEIIVDTPKEVKDIILS
jgi:phosphoglycolate phosphatase